MLKQARAQRGSARGAPRALSSDARRKARSGMPQA